MTGRTLELHTEWKRQRAFHKAAWEAKGWKNVPYVGNPARAMKRLQILGGVLVFVGLAFLILIALTAV